MLSVEINNGSSKSLYAEQNIKGDWDIRERGESPLRDDRTGNNDEITDLVLKFLDAGYERFTIHLEDNILVSPGVADHGERRVVVCFDCLTGVVARAEWTAEQVRAVVALALGGDEQPNAQSLYEIAEPAIEGWPDECRPIP